MKGLWQKFQQLPIPDFKYPGITITDSATQVQWVIFYVLEDTFEF